MISYNLSKKFPIVSMIFLLLLSPPLAADAAMSTICEFTHGPRAGTSHDYAPMEPIPVGSSCHDGQGSTGRVVPAGSGGKSATEGTQLSTICEFTNGPRAGTSHDYAPMQPIPVGSPCHDGQGSTGRVVPAGSSGKSATEGTQLSTICEFTNGPRAGTGHDYAPMQPIPVGSPCHDGQGSTGIVVPSR